MWSSWNLENNLTKDQNVAVLKHNELINNHEDDLENVCKALSSEFDEKGDILIKMFEDENEIPDPEEFD